jgi:hypothetical protein
VVHGRVPLRVHTPIRRRARLAGKSILLLPDDLFNGAVAFRRAVVRSSCRKHGTEEFRSKLVGDYPIFNIHLCGARVFCKRSCCLSPSRARRANAGCLLIGGFRITLLTPIRRKLTVLRTLQPGNRCMRSVTPTGERIGRAQTKSEVHRAPESGGLTTGNKGAACKFLGGQLRHPSHRRSRTNRAPPFDPHPGD